MHQFAFIIIALMLGGCMQDTLQAASGTLQPATQVGWTARDKKLMSNLPYAQVTIPEEYQRYIVRYARNGAPGKIVVDTDNKFLYYVLPNGKAIRYGITVGEEGQAWSGTAEVGRMEEWPPWIPTAGEQQRLGPLPAYVGADRIIRWVRVPFISIPVARTPCTASTAPTSLNISAKPSPPDASA